MRARNDILAPTENDEGCSLLLPVQANTEGELT